MKDDTKPQLASAEDRLASILSTVAAKDLPNWWTQAIVDARIELIDMRVALKKIAACSTHPISIARAALAPSPAGPDGKSLAVIYCMERAEEDVKLLREALEGMIAVAEGRFDGNPHADIDALAKARAALAPSPAGEKS